MFMVGHYYAYGDCVELTYIVLKQLLLKTATRSNIYVIIRHVSRLKYISRLATILLLAYYRIINYALVFVICQTEQHCGSVSLNK
jgi:hypothetical protein